MPDNATIHPELRHAARFFPRLNFTARSLPFLRLLANLTPAAKPPPGVAIENRFIPSAHDGHRIRLRIYRNASPEGHPQGDMPVIFWLHGGGYIIGRPEIDDPACCALVRQTRIVVVSIDYRLAPEHPFPASLDDALDAVSWSLAHLQCIDPQRYAIGGESAGGGLAAALVQRIHDLPMTQPRLQVLVYPMLDDHTCLRSDLPDPRLLTWSAASNCFGWQAYLGTSPGDAEPPAYAVPARRADLTGLPPAWIGVGSLDLFHDEDVAYARRLQQAGVECCLEVIPGAYHGFDFGAENTQVVREFRASQVAALHRWLTP